ncbi:integrase catalytic domain-containing protein [Trichonephila clavata]|uniref:Integrase catalytic domain-containing protein n=1 Tax=Trichonephila clavata TaxID=2740835 RepID=A0A8X6H976_TRICU|nr:integrase catalytic domain-containing protein [Trichonephila clavata]
MFLDILHEIHIPIGHGGKNRMIKERNLWYKYLAQNDIKQFLSVSEPCQQKRNMGKKGIMVKPMVFLHLNSIGRIDLIEWHSQPEGIYKFILVYQDHLLMFVILNSLQTKLSEKFAMHSFDIFLLLDAPCVLQLDNRREFCNKFIDDLKKTWPELKAVHSYPRYCQSQGSVEKANQDVETS